MGLLEVRSLVRGVSPPYSLFSIPYSLFCILSFCSRPPGQALVRMSCMLGRKDWEAPGVAKPFAAGSLVAVRMPDLMRSDWSQVPGRACTTVSAWYCSVHVCLDRRPRAHCYPLTHSLTHSPLGYI